MVKRCRMDRSTPYLVPPSVKDWLPEDHLARFLVDIVDQFDVSALTTAVPSRRLGSRITRR